ncbi:hypothetical protein NA57DRAFT_76955 [Rhizodiscina lignyota]|uniref:Uncharacterized protein n=1 Tax=Rhizodiscina lignyota TaxID=1504668 RepID=A0A9P4IH80_9PEZI|nr:hypothetical protein NA57DRAFT_76955 [Rhizodiscina lignyota]
MGNDCIYLCNSAQNNKSACAYYKQILPKAGIDAEFNWGGNAGHQPDDLVYVSDGDNQVWEGGPQSFTFPSSGVTLNIDIPTSAQQSQGGIVDGATASNGFENFQVVKVTDLGELVTDNDGVQLMQVYILLPVGFSV